MNSTLVRVLSAVVALVILFAIAYFAGVAGLLYVASFALILGIFEFTRMAFPKESTPRIIRFTIPAFLLFLLGITFLGAEKRMAVLGVYLAIFVSVFLWVCRGAYSNEQILKWFSSAFLGFVYFVFFPSFAIKILQMQHAAVWFSFLLLVVFAGDTFAYFGGRFLGKKKLMPDISPKKTVAGAWSGLLGSIICGVLLMLYLMPQLPWYMTALFALVSGFVAQCGDLFVSLVKRVAQVKDSGAIMPGHGGVLDRLDGIYIAAPIVYYFAMEWAGLLPHFSF